MAHTVHAIGSINSALCQKGCHFWKGVFVTDQTGPKSFVFNKCYDIGFYNFCNKHPHGKKTLLKSEKMDAAEG